MLNENFEFISCQTFSIPSIRYEWIENNFALVNLPVYSLFFFFDARRSWIKLVNSNTIRLLLFSLANEDSFPLAQLVVRISWYQFDLNDNKTVVQEIRHGFVRISAR